MKNLKTIAIGILLIFLISCTAPESTTIQFLENQGYTNVQITGYKAFSCSDDDIYATGFTAKNSNGKIVSGTVCEGFIKAKTIRFD